MEKLSAKPDEESRGLRCKKRKKSRNVSDFPDDLVLMRKHRCSENNHLGQKKAVIHFSIVARARNAYIFISLDAAQCTSKIPAAVLTSRIKKKKKKKSLARAAALGRRKTDGLNVTDP